jgi:hypothetical protein
MLPCDTIVSKASRINLDPVEFRVALPAADPPDNAIEVLGATRF